MCLYIYVAVCKLDNNNNLTLMLVLRAKHNDVFHCLYEGIIKFLVSFM